MALIVEDGTGKPDAQSYCDQTFFVDFCSQWGLSLQSAPAVSTFEAAARRGTLAFDSVYGPRFPGKPINPAQALVFPMEGLVDRRSFVLPNLPVQVIQATCVFIHRELIAPMSMYPTVTPGKSKKKAVAIEDAISVEYANTTGSIGYVDSMRPILSMVESILSPIVTLPNTGSTLIFGSAVRG